MARESVHAKLERVRPPRIHVTYDVEIGGAMEKKELPLVVGILADMSGKPEEAIPPLKKRKFVEIDRDNFNDVLAASAPRIAFQVDSRLAEDSKLNVELKFRDIEDFEPVNVLKQVEPLRKLFEARQRLADLITKLDGNDDLDRLLQEVVINTEGLQELKPAAAADEAGE
jgi:type VI secretion system protein ImpB